MKTAPDLMDLLTDLESQVIELAAVRDAAHDFITLKDDKNLYTDEDQQQVKLAYNNLKELVLN